MVKWLKDCFSGMISILFVLTVAGCSVGGAMLGLASGQMSLLILGIFGGLVVGLVVGIETFGAMATIINIAENQEKILHILAEQNGIDLAEDDYDEEE